MLAFNSVHIVEEKSFGAIYRKRIEHKKAMEQNNRNSCRKERIEKERKGKESKRKLVQRKRIETK